MKAQVAGAGWVGRKLWKVGGWLLSVVVAVYALRHDITVWWQRLITRGSRSIILPVARWPKRLLVSFLLHREQYRNKFR